MEQAQTPQQLRTASRRKPSRSSRETGQPSDRYREVRESDGSLPVGPIHTVSLTEVGTYFGDSSSGSSSEIEDLMMQRQIGKSRKSQRNPGVLQAEDPPKEEFWTESARFKNLSAALILVNIMVIIIETCFIQLQLAVFDYINMAFTMSYACELLLCFREQGIRRFLCTDDVWNKIDFVVTVLSVSDLIVDHFVLSASADNLSGASFSRLFRLIRILRVIRGLRFLNELDYVLVQVTRATLRLGLVVGIVLLASSIIVTQMLWDCSDDYVAGLFSDLGNSLWTLFRIMTLDNWAKIVEHVIQAKPEMRPFFTIFIFTTAISLISLAPAMFIDISLKRTQHEEQHANERVRARKRNEKRRLLMTLFKTVDIDETGLISMNEMKKVLTNHAILSELEELGITQASDLRDVQLGLFELSEEIMATREADDTQLTMEQFVAGVLKDQEDITQDVLWRSCTSTRLMLHDFAAIVLDDLQEIREVLLHGVDHNISRSSGTSASASIAPRGREGRLSTALPSRVHSFRQTKNDRDVGRASKGSASSKGIDYMISSERLSINSLESDRESIPRSVYSHRDSVDLPDGIVQPQVTPPGPRSRPASPHVMFRKPTTSRSSDTMGWLKPMKGVDPLLVEPDEASQSVALLSRSPMEEMSHCLDVSGGMVFSNSRGTSSNSTAVANHSDTAENDRHMVFDARFGENHGSARQVVGTTIFRV